MMTLVSISREYGCSISSMFSYFGTSDLCVLPDVQIHSFLGFEGCLPHRDQDDLALLICRSQLPPGSSWVHLIPLEEHCRSLLRKLDLYSYSMHSVFQRACSRDWGTLQKDANAFCHFGEFEAV